MPAEDFVTDGKAFDALAESGDGAGKLATGHKGSCRLGLILTLDQEAVGEVNANGFNINQNLAGASLGVGHVAVNQIVDLAVVFTYQCFHGVLNY